MRYYGEDYKLRITESLNKAHDSVTGSDYAQTIRNVDISAKNSGLKTECVNVGGAAYSHVDSIRVKLKNLVPVLLTFYEDADETSDAVLESAKKINELLKEVNDSLVKMDAAINGIGEYKGTKATLKTLKGAGLNETRCNETKAQFWNMIFYIQMANDAINSDEATVFVDYIAALQKSGQPIPDSDIKIADAIFGKYLGAKKLLPSNMLSPKDMERINAIYNYYCYYHLGPENRISDLSEQTLQNAVNAYEMINPDAKKVTNEFFKDAHALSEDVIDLNILRIKYALYTADPEERDLMLYCLPKVELNLLDPVKNPEITTPCCTYSSPPVITLDLRNGDALRCCSFFHELGHAMDGLFGFPSDNYVDDLVNDLKTHMHNALAEMGINLVADQEQEVIDYFFTSEGPNVVNSEGYDWSYPSNWTTSQAMAYYHLRDYYGYVEYDYNPAAYSSNNNEAYDVITYYGYTCGVSYTVADREVEYYMNVLPKSWHNDYSIVSDIGGGLTNYQIGGTCSTHGANSDDIPNDATIILSSSDLHDRLRYFDYYFSSQNPDDDTDCVRIRNLNIAKEFTAENWEYAVFGFDIGPTRDTFPTAYQDYVETREAMIETAYS